MKATVIKPFRDKITKVMHKPGEVVDMDDARTKGLAERGLVDVEPEPEPEEKPEKKPKRKTVKKKK